MHSPGSSLHSRDQADLDSKWRRVVGRRSFLKGVGLAELWQPLLILTAEGLLLFGLSVRKFKVKL